MTGPTASSQLDESGEINRIKERIKESVDSAFRNGAHAYYLSQLGADLGDDRKLLERLSGMKLAHFIDETFDYDIGKAGVHGNVLYINNNRPLHEILSSSSPRFKSKFWASFAIPLEQGTRRFINLDTLDFGSNLQDLTREGGEVREIEASFIAREGEDDTPQKTLDRISAWLSEQGLEATKFIKSRGRSRTERSNSLLQMIISSLNSEQLTRVTLPLDVVKVLSER